MAAQAGSNSFSPTAGNTHVARLGLILPVRETATLLRWDGDIQRAARAGATRLGSALDDADDMAQEARLHVIGAVRRTGGDSPHYIRRVIRNAVVSCLRRESRAITTRSKRGCELNANLEAPPTELDSGRASAVIAWAAGLPHRLRDIYELLYEQGLTQREAAVALGVSQPRVAQLHRALLRRGRFDLAELAA